MLFRPLLDHTPIRVTDTSLTFCMLANFEHFFVICISLFEINFYPKKVRYTIRVLTCCLLVSSADNFCKQFGPRSGPTQCWAWSGSNPFDTQMIFRKSWFWKKTIDVKKAWKISLGVKLNSFDFEKTSWSGCSMFIIFFTLNCLLVSSAEKLLKEFGPRSGPANIWPDQDPNCLLLWLFLKELFEKVDFEKTKKVYKITQQAKSYPVCLMLLIDVLYVSQLPALLSFYNLFFKKKLNLMPHLNHLKFKKVSNNWIS